MADAFNPLSPQATQATAPPQAPAASKKPVPAAQKDSKPRTPAQVAEFAGMWSDEKLTVLDIAATYGISRECVSLWRRDFDLPERKVALRDAAKTRGIMGNLARVAADPRTAQSALAAVVNGELVDPKVKDAWDPMRDKEIAGAVADILAEARQMTGHSDLTLLSRKVAKLTMVCAAKAPINSWATLQVVMGSLNSTLLNMRRVEAKLPQGQHDPVALRREAATQMLTEMKGVLDPAEQAALAKLVKAAAERLMARGAGSGGPRPTAKEGNA